jgi:hypothetical protein
MKGERVYVQDAVLTVKAALLPPTIASHPSANTRAVTRLKTAMKSAATENYHLWI